MEIFMRENSNKISFKVLVNIFGRMVVLTQDNLKREKDKEKENGNLLTVTNIREITEKIKKMAMEFFVGLMEKYTMDILKMI
jgi:hypothetical protein